MIFTDKYSGNENELVKKAKYKEFSLIQSGADYTDRSVGLIYDMYCRCLNTTHGIGLLMFHLSIPDDSGECSESELDNLFHIAQDSVKHRNTSSDNSIGLISKTYRKDFSTNHEGCFLIPISDEEKHDILQGDKKTLLRELLNIPSRIISGRKAKLDTESTVYFSLKGKDKNHGIILSDSNFEVHEQGFATLCEIAQLSMDKPEAESPLIRTRYGYSPVHGHFGNDSLEPNVAQTQQTKPFLDNALGEYKLKSQQPW
jgi:hypothetical protein